MRVAVFSAKPHDRQFFDNANAGRHELHYLEARLTPETARLAEGASVACLFANDQADAAAIAQLAAAGVRLIALRSAGFNNVDLAAALAHRMAVCRVPAYSPEAVAEHTFALLLASVRKVHLAYDRVRNGNFSLDGLLGFNLAGKTIGIIGVGNIGSAVARIAGAFGCRVLGCDPSPREVAGVRYCPLEELLEGSDIVTLHCPLEESTRHLIDARALGRMRHGAILVNTCRGAVVDTPALIEALERGQLGAVALDVYEFEDSLFFENRSQEGVRDELFLRLLSLSNVLVTGHQGFFTVEALTNIAATTIENVSAFERTGSPLHAVPGSVAVTAVEPA